MATQTTSMNKIKQVLRFHLEGASNRSIATVIEMDKETVNRYVTRANADSMAIEELLCLDDAVLEYRMTGGQPSYPDKRFEVFKEMLPYLEKEMHRSHVTLRLLWEEYRIKYPDGYGLTQFRYHYKQNVKAQKGSTILRDTYVAGEKLQVDFAGLSKAFDKPA